MEILSERFSLRLEKAAYNSRLGGIETDELDASLDKTPYADNTPYRHLPYGDIPKPQYD
ncbi:hypothetical protein [Paenibacillus pinisoli]|uniref:hypothetical protein n=1 Tax=Paenibacillus pinisoli TaxID=1276110 RepID=UPI001402C4BA|nr:hypothetical protein [Paenibacillus pinisoli]